MHSIQRFTFLLAALAALTAAPAAAQITGGLDAFDRFGRALATGEPSLSIPCFAERRYGGVMEDELLMAIPPHFLPTVIDGLRALARNGLRYPIPPYGVQSDARAGLGFSYG